MKSLYRVTSQESTFFKRIGIVDHKDYSLQHGQKYIFGTTEVDGASVNVWVTAMPARFWEFRIDLPDGDRYIVKTGSGDIQKFWPTVELIAKEMLTVR